MWKVKRSAKNLQKRGVYAEDQQAKVSSEDFQDDEYESREFFKPAVKRPKNQPWNEE